MSNLQLELLKLYSTNISEEQLLEIKKMLAKYFKDQIDKEMDKLWGDKNWSEKTIEEWKNTHMRTPYKNQNSYFQKY